MGGREVRIADLCLLSPGLPPTLALPVMPKRKLKVLLREAPAQVPESSSSWLPHLLRSVPEDRNELSANAQGKAVFRKSQTKAPRAAFPTPSTWIRFPGCRCL